VLLQHSKDEQAVQYLIFLGADINYVFSHPIAQPQWDTALGRAAYYGDVDTVMMLLRQGAKAEATGSKCPALFGVCCRSDNFANIYWSAEKRWDIPIDDNEVEKGDNEGVAICPGPSEVWS
jgi:hypothetical protein